MDREFIASQIKEFERLEKRRDMIEDNMKKAKLKLLEGWRLGYSDLGRREIFDIFFDFKIGDELNILLRSGIRTSMILRIPDIKEKDRNILFLTKDYGLKVPRLWSSFKLLDSWEARKGGLEVSPDGDLRGDKREDKWERLIELSVLKERKDFDQDKLQAFFRFLRKAVKLFTESRDFQSKLDKTEIYVRLRQLFDFSGSKEFEKVFKSLCELEDTFPEFPNIVKDLKDRVKALETELIDYNKPFRVLCQLREK